MSQRPKNKTKRKFTAEMQAAVDRAFAALEKEHGPGNKLVSAFVRDSDGNKHPVDITGVEPRPDLAKDVVNVQMPPDQAQLAREVLAKVLRDLQAQFDAGKLKCLAAVAIDEDGVVPIVAGVDCLNALPHCLQDLANFITSDGDEDDDDEVDKPVH